MASSIACEYRPCPTRSSGISSLDVNDASLYACNAYFLVNNPSVQCWNRVHIDRSKFTVLAMIWYIATSIIFGTQYGDPDNKELDVGFSPLYNMVINVLKAAMLLVVTLVTHNPYVVVGFLMVGYIFCCNYTLNFKWIFDTPPCNLKSVLVWRMCTFVSCMIATFAVIIAFMMNDHNSALPLLIFVFGTLGTFTISMKSALKGTESSPVECDRDAFKENILVLEERLMDSGCMHRTWKNERKTWHRLVRSVREAAKNSQQEVTDSTARPQPSQRTQVDTIIYAPHKVLELQKNGQNLLLILEQYVLYTTYSLRSLSQRNEWIEDVSRSTWTGLLAQLHVLSNNLDCTFNDAYDLDPETISSVEYTFEADPQDTVEPPPVYQRKSREEIARESAVVRENVLQFFESVNSDGLHYKRLFDKLLPDGPVFKTFTSNGNTFDLRFRLPGTGIVTEYEPPGFSMAVGARFNLGKKLCGVVNNTTGVTFTAGCCPVGEKGPIGVSVTSVGFVTDGSGVVDVVVNGKTLKFDVAMASCKTVQWS